MNKEVQNELMRACKKIHVSIIIPAWNQHEMTKQCIESIERNTSNLNYEIILVDNGSQPAYEYDNQIVKKIIRNESNLGFPVAVNQGIRAADGHFICLLNNDTVVTKGWLEGLLDALLIHDYDIVSPMTNYVAGLQRAITATYEDEKSLNIAAYEWHQENKGNIQEVNFVIGFCMVFRKSLFDEIGEFDESMFPTSGEEIDFCFRCRTQANGGQGGKVGIVKDVYIHHYGSQTFQEMQSAGILNYEETCKKCSDHLAKKWGADFWQEQANLSYLDGLDNSGNLAIDNDITAEHTTPIRLNLGCGRYKLKGFINIDQYEKVNPDIIANALRLLYQPNTVDEIYCGHMLEHLTYEEGKEALKYWYSLLKPNGIITVTVPDFDYLADEYLSKPKGERIKALQLFNDLYIYSYCQESLHKYCYNAELLHHIMKQSGFTKLERLPLNHHYFVDPVKWQVAYTGRKPEEGGEI